VICARLAILMGEEGDEGVEQAHLGGGEGRGGEGWGEMVQEDVDK
jgi:hypothetical protein